MTVSLNIDTFANAGGVTIRRPKARQSDGHGRWILPEGETEQYDTIAVSRVVVVPGAGKFVERLSEGLRTRQAIRVYTTERLQTAQDPAGVPPDLIDWQGETYEVQILEDWTAHGGAFKALALKVEA